MEPQGVGAPQAAQGTPPCEPPLGSCFFLVFFVVIFDFCVSEDFLGSLGLAVFWVFGDFGGFLRFLDSRALGGSRGFGGFWVFGFFLRFLEVFGFLGGFGDLEVFGFFGGF